MSALEWHARFKGAPRLGHDCGLVYVDLDGRTIMFPSEAAARFFFEAFRDVPRLEAENAALRQRIDSEALAKALSRVSVLEAETAVLQQRQAVLQEQLAKLADGAATARKRARILAIALKNKIAP